MNELDKDLLTGEQIAFQTSKHWFSPVRGSAVAVLLILGSFLARWLAPTGDGFLLGPLDNVIVFLANLALVVAIAWIAFNVFAFFSAHFGVTNLRVLRKEGIIRRRSSETLLTAVTDVRLLEPALGRMLGYGDLQVYTAAGNASKDSFDTVKDAPQLRTAIQEQQLKAKAGDRPNAAAAAAAPAPAAAPMDMGASLESLAALRDQGLITAEEYDAKRTEIIGRL